MTPEQEEALQKRILKLEESIQAILARLEEGASKGEVARLQKTLESKQEELSSLRDDFKKYKDDEEKRRGPGRNDADRDEQDLWP